MTEQHTIEIYDTKYSEKTGVICPHDVYMENIDHIMFGVFFIMHLPIWNDTHERD